MIAAPNVPGLISPPHPLSRVARRVPGPRPPSPTDSILCLVRALGDVGMAGRAGGRVDKTEGAAYTFDEEGADGPWDSEGSSAWGQTQGREDTGEQGRSEEKGFT